MRKIRIPSLQPRHSKPYPVPCTQGLTQPFLVIAFCPFLDDYLSPFQAQLVSLYLQSHCSLFKIQDVCLSMSFFYHARVAVGEGYF